MAKINVVFNNKNYNIDQTSLSAASDALESHLSTVMNGTGSVVDLGGVSYNVDSAKLSTATNAFISHLGTIAGSGSSVVVNGVEYGISSEKLSDAIAEFSNILGDLSNSNDIVDEVINYKSETVVLDANSTSLIIGTIEGLGYVEDKRNHFYDGDCFVVTLNDTELVIDKAILTSEEGYVLIQSDVTVGQYNGIDILCTVKKDRKTGLNTMTIELAEAPTEPISANLTYKTVNVAF